MNLRPSQNQLVISNQTSNYHTEPVQEVKFEDNNNQTINIDFIKREPVYDYPKALQNNPLIEFEPKQIGSNAISFADKGGFDNQPQLTLAMMSQQYGIPEWMPKTKTENKCIACTSKKYPNSLAKPNYIYSHKKQ